MNKNKDDYEKLFNETMQYGLKFSDLTEKYGLQFVIKLFTYLKDHTCPPVAEYDPIYPDNFHGDQEVYENELRDAKVPIYVRTHAVENRHAKNADPAIRGVHHLKFGPLR